jgi:transcriptional regulator of met regulon
MSDTPLVENGYRALIHAIREELKPLKDTVDETREDVRALRHETYTREMIDEKLKNIAGQLEDQDKDLKGIHKLIGNSGRELLERLALATGVAYSLVYVIPHLFH